MKKAQYKTSAALTAKELLGCQCDCQCSGKDKEKIVCVHILPLIFQLSLLLMEGLAENILLELSARFQQSDEEELSNSDIQSMKNSIRTLMAACSILDVADEE